MSELSATKIRFRNGIWEGRVTGAPADGSRPEISVLYLDQPLEGVALAATGTAGEWDLKVPVPQHALADGVQSFLITSGGERLASFALIAGDTASDDLRAEVELLRAELDMLKRAFRRHCLETA